MMDWNRLLSRARLGATAQSHDSEARTAFQRDFDRIVFSAAFRRLQDKTQVFPLAQSDYVRTRLTHSLEVSSVGRSLGTLVGESVIRRHGLAGVYPQDFGAIVAAAGLAHDLGNPPFGHAGEEAIRCWFATSAVGQTLLAQLDPAEQADFLNFEGNAQGFRLLTRLQTPDNRGGLQLTCATLGAFSKYPRAAWWPKPVAAGVGFRKFGFCRDDAELFGELAATLGLQSAGTLAWQRHPLAYLLEAADDVCYRIIDIEDAFRQQVLDFQETVDLLRPLAGLAADAERLARMHRTEEKIEYLRAKAIGQIIEQLHTAFMAHEAAILSGTFAVALLDVIPAASALQALKRRAEARVYVARPVVEIGVAGFEVLAGLLEAFVGAVNDVAERGRQAWPKNQMLLHLLPEQYLGPGRLPAASVYQRVLGITDFISGMTDSYAVTLYKKITGISLPTG